MQTVRGKVSEFLHDPGGSLSGIKLDCGEEVRFSADRADLVTETVKIGSQVEISGDLRQDSLGEKYLHVALITNLDSKRTASLPALVCLGKPGMLSVATPKTTASLAHPRVNIAEKPAGTASEASKDGRLLDRLLEKMASQPRLSRDADDENPLKHNPSLSRATKHDAATGLEHAYDGLHRTQAILAYLNIMQRQVHGISQFHDEAKHTYEQALSWYEAQEYEGAREFSAASRCLSRVVEIVISRTLRSDTGYPSVVPPPPEHSSACGDARHVRHELRDVEAILSRIRWLLDNGTLPLEDRTQVRRIASWGEAFHQQSRRMYRSGSLDDADELAQAANAAAHSAEHICRKWYVVQAIHPRLVAVEPSPRP